jgi:hypothetical protein
VVGITLLRACASAAPETPRISPSRILGANLEFHKPTAIGFHLHDACTNGNIGGAITPATA